MIWIGLKDADKQPRIYHQIEWMVDTQPQNPCSDSGDWNADYNVCMKGTLPRAMAGHFLLIGDELKLYKFEKEDTPNKLTSYIAECQGDSGSGHWVTKTYPQNFIKKRAMMHEELL